MATYVYSAHPSNGARDMTKALEAVRLRKFDGMDFFRKGRRIIFAPTDVLVCWGSTVAEFDGPRIINAAPRMNKYEELVRLRDSNINCPVVERWNVSRSGAIPSGYLGRSLYHSGGADFNLSRADHRIDYLTGKLDLVEEYRIHIFDGKSIRAGLKQVRDGFTRLEDELDYHARKRGGEANIAHPWVRSFDHGWRINYDNFKSKAEQRDIARRAVAALGLTFGAVDVGRDSTNTYYILEVNRSPGADPPTIESYARAIRRWIENPRQIATEQPAEEIATPEPPRVVAPPPTVSEATTAFTLSQDQVRAVREAARRWAVTRASGRYAPTIRPTAPAPATPAARDAVAESARWVSPSPYAAWTSASDEG